MGIPCDQYVSFSCSRQDKMIMFFSSTYSHYIKTRNLGARWAPISSWWPSATLLALRACLTSSFTPFGHSSRVTHADDKFTSVLEQVRFQERGEQCHFGSFWAILGHFGPFWAILVEFWLQKHHLHCIVKFKKNAPKLDFLCRE